MINREETTMTSLEDHHAKMFAGVIVISAIVLAACIVFIWSL
jgi:hypothetical protein